MAHRRRFPHVRLSFFHSEIPLRHLGASASAWVPYLNPYFEGSNSERMKAAMTSKGQITIPIEIRERLGLEPGQVLDFDEQAAYLKATKVFDAARMDSALGRFRTHLKGKSSSALLDETRGAVALPPEPKPASKPARRA